MTAPPVCWICLGEAPDDETGRYHRACLQDLFGLSAAPRIDFDPLAITTWADEHGGQLSISGFQPKAPAAIAEEGPALVLVERDSTHILKPPHVSYPHIPQNEHLTMRLGRAAGLDVAEHGVVALADGSLAYVTRRFDRPLGGKGPRVHVVDFCQLAGKDPSDKDASTAEECAALARRYGKPGTVLDVFRLLVFSYWVRNGDLHLKNLMLREAADGSYTLAPAYDLLCTEVYNVKGMILPVQKERVNIPRRLWLDFAEIACGIERSAAEACIDAMLERQPAIEALVERSLLPNPEWKNRYRSLLRKRSKQLAGRV